MKKYRIKHHTEEFQCDCGYPLYVGDTCYFSDYAGDCFCSQTCLEKEIQKLRSRDKTFDHDSPHYTTRYGDHYSPSNDYQSLEYLEDQCVGE